MRDFSSASEEVGNMNRLQTQPLRSDQRNSFGTNKLHIDPVGHPGLLPDNSATKVHFEHKPDNDQHLLHQWATEYLALELPVDEAGMPLPLEHSPSPFPRYGHALTTTCTPSGEFFLFGGMSAPKQRHNHTHNPHANGRSRSRNRRHHNAPRGKSASRTESDLYIISGSDHTDSANVDQGGSHLSARLLHTTGEKPPPRIGYSCALLEGGDGLVVWGGRPGSAAAHDAVRHGRTETYAESLPCARHSTHGTKHTCDSVYCLDFDTDAWKRIESETQGPTGHDGVKGHAVALAGSLLFVFGGIGKSNDLWIFNFRDRLPGWQVCKTRAFSSKPPPRSGHTLVSCKGNLILFGGAHEDVHYDDTWLFDPSRHVWTQLQCAGIRPTARQGHVSVVMKDAMFVYGGRDTLGCLIGELICLRLSDNIWLSFDDFESRPTGRMGHSMSCSGSKLFLIGGEGEVYSSRKGTKNNVVYAIDTGHFLPVGDADGQLEEHAPLIPNIRRRYDRISAAHTSYTSNATRSSVTASSPAFSEFFDSSELEKRQRHTQVTRHSILGLIPSLLPQFQLIQRAQTISSTTIAFSYSAFETYTYYRELTQATTDSEIEEVLRRLLQEWQFVGVSLIGIAALDVTIFEFSPTANPALYDIGNFALGAVSVSAITAGLGILFDGWFLFRYSSADPNKFKILATDTHSSYFYFCIHSRLPGLMAFISWASTAIALFTIAWQSRWSKTVITFCSMALLIYFLEYLVIASRRLVGGVWWIFTSLIPCLAGSLWQRVRTGSEFISDSLTRG